MRLLAFLLDLLTASTAPDVVVAVNLLFAARSGWGKSYHSQAWLEENIPKYDTSIILDYKDEYRGLVKHGLCKFAIAGPNELDWSVAHWQKLLERNKHIVLARHVNDDEWRELAAPVIAAARRMEGSTLVAIDEGHWVAPQGESYPKAVKGLATTGRGEGVSGMWITQRLAEIDKTIVTQCQARMLGGFGSKDIKHFKSSIEYPPELHNPQKSPQPGIVPDELLPTDRETPTSLQKHTVTGDDGEPQTVGSEWIYSDDQGNRERVNTRGIDMESTHYGSQGEQLEMPNYG